MYGIDPAAEGDSFAGEKNMMKLCGTARYISGRKLPLLFSDKNYGLVFAAQSAVICCDIPAYGTYLYGENEAQMDYYFIAGRNRKELMENYSKLLS